MKDMKRRNKKNLSALYFAGFFLMLSIVGICRNRYIDLFILLIVPIIFIIIYGKLNSDK